MDDHTLSSLANPHVCPGPAPDPHEACMEAAAALPPLRVRQVTLSPHEEYQRRPGEVETIPDALAALILSKKARVEVGLRGVTLEIEGTKRTYWHPDSPLCHRIGDGEKRRVFAVWARQDASKIHLLDEQGRYLETLPEKGRVAWFSEEGADELAAHRRTISRVYDHLQRLHQGDSITAAERTRLAAAEAEQVLRATASFPAPESTHRDQREATPAPVAEAAARGAARLDTAARRTATARTEADALLERRGRQAETVDLPAVYDPFDL